MDLTSIKRLFQQLLEWHKINKRNFPWRTKDTSLYEIFIAEILLRKTTAEMVSGFFPNFIKKYPNFNSIKSVSYNELENDLIPLGLYKTRAKIIKNLAKELNNKYDGKIPENFDDLIKLHGIGKYIANAVLCFGFNKDVILLDTNINRIFSRILNKEYPKKINDNHPLWNELKKYVSNNNYKILFMALIDFGAIMCKKKNYNCNICPILNFCEYNKKLL